MNDMIAYARALSDAGLLPKDFQKQPGNILYAIEVAKDLHVSPVAAIRGMYVIGGRPGFHSHFMLAMANRAGVFEKRIEYRVDGQGDSLKVTAFATLKDGTYAEETVTIAMAKAEGWTRNSKYQSLPVQMLKKRAVRMLIDNYCPEVMSGLGVEEEQDGEPLESPKAVVQKLNQKYRAQPASLPSAKEVLRENKHDPSQAAANAMNKTLNGTDEKIESEMADTSLPPERQMTTAPLDLENVEHRKLVTQALDHLAIEGRWRNLHRAKLSAFLAEQHILAEAEHVFEAVHDYVVQNRPAEVQP